MAEKKVYEVKINDVVVKSPRKVEMGNLKQFKRTGKLEMKFNGPRVERVRFERIAFDKDAKDKLKSGQSFLITNPEAVTNKGIRTKDGLFSPYFGATMIKTNTIPYSCECGRTNSAMKEGEICPYCDTEVQYITANIKKNAFISLGKFKVLTYHGYHSFMTFIKKKKISLQKNRNIGLKGKMIKEDDVITMLDIYDYYEENEQEIGLPIEYAFTSHIPVINATLRPLIQDNAKMRQYKINMFYGLILQASLNLKIMSHYGNENELNNILFEIQECFNEVNDIIVKELSSKTGDIRKHFTTCRMDWSSRMVIVPGEDLKPDEVDIPYPTIVKYYEEELVRILHKEIGYSKADAMDIFLKSQNTISDKMKRALEILLKNYECWIIINRNPTIKYGSILYMKIRKYNEDINDLTLKIPAAIRPSMNADHDGDQLTGVCNKLVSDSKYSMHNIFKYIFCPKYMFVDSANGLSNRNMMFTKDHATILTDLLNLDNMIEILMMDPEIYVDYSGEPLVNSYQDMLKTIYEADDDVLKELDPVMETFLEDKIKPI